MPLTTTAKQQNTTVVAFSVDENYNTLATEDNSQTSCPQNSSHLRIQCKPSSQNGTRNVFIYNDGFLPRYRQIDRVGLNVPLDT